MQKGYYAASFCRILMARDFFTMDDFDLAGHTVLLRVDINSPVDPATGQLLNDARIREHLRTIPRPSRRTRNGSVPSSAAPSDMFRASSAVPRSRRSMQCRSAT